MSQAETTKPKGAKNTKYMLVRYGRMGLMGWFEHNETTIPKLNTKVIIKTERGLELGEVVGVHNYRNGQFRSTPEQVEHYYGDLGLNSPIGPGGTFVRFATHEDLREQEHLVQSEQEEIACCEMYIKQLGLPMRIIDAEHLFGGERIIYYFTSEGRVDFRELVKTLAREYQTRIELRQIGARDEARLISDYETCGQQCCCSRFLRILEPVNMRMAKLQKATLDPSKISGHCGRLKCCLRYEDLTYTELKDNLPTRNSMVRTPKGVGRVIDVQILTQLVVVQDAMGDRQAWPVEELLALDQTEESETPTPSKRRVHPLYQGDDGVKEVEDDAQQEQEQQEASTLVEDLFADEVPTSDTEPQSDSDAQQSDTPEQRPKNRNALKRGGKKGRSKRPSNVTGDSSATQHQPNRRSKNRPKKRRGGKRTAKNNRPDTSDNTNAQQPGE
jgi:cell fate regulator YaaT (PSP1 superfamily)